MKLHLYREIVNHFMQFLEDCMKNPKTEDELGFVNLNSQTAIIKSWLKVLAKDADTICYEDLKLSDVVIDDFNSTVFYLLTGYSGWEEDDENPQFPSIVNVISANLPEVKFDMASEDFNKLLIKFVYDMGFYHGLIIGNEDCVWD